MTLSRQQLIYIVLGIVVLVLVVFLFARGCTSGGHVTFLTEGGIDAGPGEAVIAARLDGEVRAGEARIEMIEHKFDRDLDAFDAQQRADYERLRGGDDLDAAARMLSDWNRERRARKEDAGP